MLTLTDRAVEAIQNLTTYSELPNETAGLRIVSQGAAQDPDRGRLALSLSQGPHGGDEIVESGPARVFLESDAAQVLGDQQLDAEVGTDGSVKFLIGPQT